MSDKGNLEGDVLLAARDVGIGTILFRNTLAKQLKLNLTESLCLTLLGVNGRLSPSELARLIGLTTGSTTTMIDRLEKRGYVLRKANSRDRRGVIVELTDCYRKESKEMVVPIQEAHKELIRGYSADELSLILDFLRQFTINLANNSKDVRYLIDTSCAES